VKHTAQVGSILEEVMSQGAWRSGCAFRIGRIEDRTRRHAEDEREDSASRSQVVKASLYHIILTGAEKTRMRGTAFELLVKPDG
jgi:hypothetical protein